MSEIASYALHWELVDEATISKRKKTERGAEESSRAPPYHLVAVLTLPLGIGHLKEMQDVLHERVTKKRE